MQNFGTVAQQLLSHFGFDEASIAIDAERRRVSLSIRDAILTPQNHAALITHLSRILRLIAKKYDEGPIIVDLNNYRQERERLIVELAKAAARKAAITRSSVSLPPMNAYERHLVHQELSMRPDVKTESTGEKQGRYVVVSFID